MFQFEEGMRKELPGRYCQEPAGCGRLRCRSDRRRVHPQAVAVRTEGVKKNLRNYVEMHLSYLYL